MTTLVREHGTVVKSIDRTVADPYFASMPRDAASAARYLSILRDAGVPLPGDLALVGSAAGTSVRHSWIPGPTLLELPGWRSAEFLAAVISIARWVRALQHTDARLDANLANFVIPDGGNLVCIDVLPPLLAADRPPEACPWEQVIGGLCFDADVTLCALAGYAARHLMRVLEPGPVATTAIVSALRICPGHPGPCTLATRWFHSRLLAVSMATRGQLSTADVERLFTATSVGRLQAASPAIRQQHAHTALADIAATIGRRTS